MSLLAAAGRRNHSAAIVSSSASRRYVAIVRYGVTLLAVVSLASACVRGEGLREQALTTTASRGAYRRAPAGAPERTSRPDSRGRALHDVHLTYSRLEVSGSRIRWRVRLFRDDLEKSMRSYAHLPALTAASPAADSLFGAYFNDRVRLATGGTPLKATVLESGRDSGSADQEMWWYLIGVDATQPIRSLSIQVELFFEYFADQRNIVTVTGAPGGRRHSLYFAAGDAEAKQVVF